MATSTLYKLPIASRPSKTWTQVLNGILFALVFNTGIILITFFEFMFLLPFLLLPFPSARALHDEGVRFAKGGFTTLMLLMNQLFAPTTVRLTFEREGAGAFSDQDISDLVVTSKGGRVLELKLPRKLVVTANHQIYADWWYMWCFLYFANLHRNVFIVLKRSLKWVPIIGWGMQLFRFIFLARSWASDRLVLSRKLARLGRKAQQNEEPFLFLIYPEGTLPSGETRPKSKAYAEKLGIPDMKHTLLPRSTGLLYSLRSLAPKIPDLYMLDVTMAYPGVPPAGCGQLYYTLRSIFLDRVSPPVIHMHLRLFKVSEDLPIGDLTEADMHSIPKAANGSGNAESVETTIPEAEAEKFDVWLRELWRAKDQNIDKFHETGILAEKPAFDIPLQLRSYTEMPYASAWFSPVVVYYFLRRFV